MAERLTEANRRVAVAVARACMPPGRRLGGGGPATVVIGTGAGGAVMAKELAERGHAVLMVEEGEYYSRSSFTGHAVDNLRRFYRDAGATGSLGNCVIPIPMGRLVGGSTAINTGTCWRTPDWVLQKWVDQGLDDLAPALMEPYFERGERELQVGPADPA